MKQLSLFALMAIALGLSACSSSGHGGGGSMLTDKTAENKIAECPKISGYYCRAVDRNDSRSHISEECVQRNLTTNKAGVFVVNEEKLDHSNSSSFEVPVDGKVRSMSGTADGKSSIISTQAFCSGGKLTRSISASSEGSVLNDVLTISADGQTLTIVTLGSARGMNFPKTTVTYTRKHD